MRSAAAEKRTLRRAMRARLAEVTPPEREARSRSAAGNLLAAPDLQREGDWMAFASMPSEIDTAPLIAALLAARRRVALPRIDPGTRSLAAYWIDTPDSLVVNRWGIPEPEPDPSRRAAPEDIAFIVVPGLAFDPAGARLGRAGGYYDRFLRASGRGPLRVGLFYAIQQLPAIPVEAWDERLDIIVTDAGIVRCRGED